MCNLVLIKYLFWICELEKKFDISGQVDTLFQAKKDIMKSDMDRWVESECGEEIVNAPLSKGTRDF